MDTGTGKSLNITRANGIQYSSSIETALPPLEWLLTKQVDSNPQHSAWEAARLSLKLLMRR